MKLIRFMSADGPLPVFVDPETVRNIRPAGGDLTGTATVIEYIVGDHCNVVLVAGHPDGVYAELFETKTPEPVQ